MREGASREEAWMTPNPCRRAMSPRSLVLTDERFRIIPPRRGFVAPSLKGADRVVDTGSAQTTLAAIARAAGLPSERVFVCAIRMPFRL
jgi:hypothetical protein